jgi:hypothetical protein
MDTGDVLGGEFLVAVNRSGTFGAIDFYLAIG